MEPLLPTGSDELEDLAREVVSRSAAMGGQLHPRSQEGIINLLRLINSYYSNQIEGNSTHPVDIERALREDYSKDSAKRNLPDQYYWLVHWYFLYHHSFSDGSFYQYDRSIS